MINKSLYFTVFNGVWFQLFWWLTILQLDWAVLLCTGLIVLHLIVSPCRRADLLLLVAIAPTGWLFDGLMQALGIIRFDGAWAVAGITLPPLWLLLLWCGFVFTLHHSLAWLHRLPRWLLGLVGGFSAAGSYFAGARLGAAEIDQPVFFWLAYMVFWAVLLLVVLGPNRVQQVSANRP